MLCPKALYNQPTSTLTKNSKGKYPMILCYLNNLKTCYLQHHYYSQRLISFKHFIKHRLLYTYTHTYRQTHYSTIWENLCYSDRLTEVKYLGQFLPHVHIIFPKYGKVFFFFFLILKPWIFNWQGVKFIISTFIGTFSCNFIDD